MTAHDETPTLAEQGRCEQCGHGAHVLTCLNMASDNGCSCRGLMDDPMTLVIRDAIDSMFGTDPKHWLNAAVAARAARLHAAPAQPAVPVEALAQMEVADVAQGLIESDAITPDSEDRYPRCYIVDPDNVEYLVKTVLALAASPPTRAHAAACVDPDCCAERGRPVPQPAPDEGGGKS